MALGHFMMTQEPLFYVALATIAIGNGLFLPSLPSQIRDLYQPGDPRAGRAYNVYYVGVNIGGFLAMLVCGALGETLGWHWGFGAAGVGMVIGLLIYLWGQRYLPAQALQPRVEQPAAHSRKAWRATRCCCSSAWVWRSPCSAVRTSRSATPWRCGLTSASTRWWVNSRSR